MWMSRPKGLAALHIAVGRLRIEMRVEVDRDIGVSATTVGELRKVTAWRESGDNKPTGTSHPESAVEVDEASGGRSPIAETVVAAGDRSRN